MSQYRNYSDDDKATALAFFDACNNIKMAARECGVPLQTLRNWIAAREDDAPSAPTTELVTEKKIDLADAFEQLAEKCVSHALKYADTESAYHATGMAEKAVMTMRLLREQATSISQSMPATVEERDAEAMQLIERVKLRMVSGG